jgi:outer membrane protein assembly factor BamD (BamD/ComL family)
VSGDCRAPLDLIRGGGYRRAMKFGPVRLVLLIAILVVAIPFRSPAPFVYRPGEGWTYEPVGATGDWMKARAKDQLEVAQAAFDKQAYSLALKAANRVVTVWPLSDYAPQGQYLVGRCYEAQGKDEKAFKAYQKLLEKQPKIANYQEILQRQYEIANKYLAGKWFRLWGLIPLYPSMDKTAEMYTKIVKNGAYSDVAPQAQMKVGAAREKQSNFPMAVKAYELAADRYADRPQVAADALYKAGSAHRKQAQTGEYDQSTAGKAIATFTDFMTIYPDDSRVNEAQKMIGELRTEQAHGNFQIAKFYEKYKKWKGSLVYYNEVLLHDPNSPYSTEARQRIDALKKRVQPASNAQGNPPGKPPGPPPARPPSPPKP